MKRYAIYLLVLPALLMGCSRDTANEENEVPVIRILADTEPRMIDLSEVMDIERVFPLETREDYLVGGGLGGLTPAGDYLLIREGVKRVQQYTADGEFVRVLITGGGGPEEYDFLLEDNMSVDVENNVLYFSDGGDRKHIRAIDLETGKHLSRIALPEIGNEEAAMGRSYPGLSKLLFVNDTLFAIVPGRGSNQYSFYFMNTAGRLLWGIPTDTSHLSYSAEQVGNEIHFRKTYLETSDPDTIYSVSKEGTRKPSSILILSPRELKTNEMLNWTPFMVGPTRVMISYSISESFGTPGSGPFGTRSVDRKYFLADKLSGTAVAFNSYKIDFLGGMEFTGNSGTRPYIGVNGDVAALRVDAFDFRQHAQEALKRNDLDTEVRTRLEDLMSKVTDDSNPIVLVGKLK